MYILKFLVKARVLKASICHNHIQKLYVFVTNGLKMGGGCFGSSVSMKMGGAFRDLHIFSRHQDEKYIRKGPLSPLRSPLREEHSRNSRKREFLRKPSRE